MAQILAADIGGTNSRFAVFELHEDRLDMGPEVWLSTREAPDFAGLMRMLAESELPLAPSGADCVALAVAGPVSGGVYCNPPNIPWDVDLSHAEETLGFSNFVLINDFAAQAFAARSPIMAEALTVLPGREQEEGVVGVIGAGTGLGKAALIPDGRGWLALPTEGGHSLFPFSGVEEFEFQRFAALRSGRDQVIGDMVLSGSGLSALHAFHNGEELPPAEVAARALAEDSVVLEWFSRFYGRACRHLALDLLAMGGVVVTGGIAAKTPELVTHEAFANEFRHSETHAELLARIPVVLNRRENSGLWGAAFAAGQRLRRRP